jgi:hypothetical protein
VTVAAFMVPVYTSRAVCGFVVPIPILPVLVIIKLPAAVEFVNWKTFPVVEDPMTVRTFAAAAGVDVTDTDATFMDPVYKSRAAWGFVVPMPTLPIPTKF